MIFAVVYQFASGLVETTACGSTIDEVVIKIENQGFIFNELYDNNLVQFFSGDKIYIGQRTITIYDIMG